jgi:hypothetical protein
MGRPSQDGLSRHSMSALGPDSADFIIHALHGDGRFFRLTHALLYGLRWACWRGRTSGVGRDS